jgi:CheY-like chemotaxis protein/HPt (histidine-containing phosphotransfer) domain-containing protein
MLHELQEIEQVLPEVQAAPAALTGSILLAEDGRDNARFISAVLAETGVEIVRAENGRKAVDLAFSRQFDLILMDIQMPVMDGYTATAEIRSRGNRIPIVALTAEAMAPERSRAFAAGITEYLTKPIEPSSLLRAVAKYLQVSSTEPRRPAMKSNQLPHRSKLAGNPRWQKLVDQYTAELPEDVATLTELLTRNRFAELAVLLHQIKGSGGNYGFAEITSLAGIAEKHLLENRVAEAAASIERLLQFMRGVEGYNIDAEKHGTSV